jgi:serine/threonine-protein kinase
VDRACDAFEAAWRAGQSPRIEASLAGVPAAERAAFLRELLAAELELRRARGEEPRPGDYLRRFPDHAALIDRLFLAPTSPPDGAPLDGTAAEGPGDDSALTALLAYRLGLVGREALAESVRDWAPDRTRSLVQVLVDRGALTAEGLDRLMAAPAVLGADGAGPGPGRPAVGETTSGGRRFRVLRLHARGGLGAVFVARDDELNRDVALKEILPRFADDDRHRARFQFEAEITGGLEHPGIVPVYGLGAYADGRPYYAMRFIRGDSLKEAIERFHADAALRNDPGRRSLGLRGLLRRFVDVCNAIDYAHSRGVLHRDIKPGNIIVGRYGETLVVDWGLAKPLGRVEPGREAGEPILVPSSASGSAETLPGSALGTPAYMSPEQARGELDRLGPRSDVYSMGATLCCLMTGRPPFAGEEVGALLHKVRRGEFTPPRQVAPWVDRALEAVCLKATAAEPEGRYASCRALADDVERWMADEPVSAWREPFTARALRWARRNRALMTATAASVVVALIGLAGVLTVQTRANRALTEKNDALVAANRREAAANAALVAANVKVRARFDLAVEAIRTFHAGVSGDLLLKEKRFEALREKLLGGAIRFYDRLTGLLEGEADPPSRRALARAYHEVGKLTASIGQTDRALAAHRRALDERRRLAAEAGPGDEARAEVARSLVALGMVQEATGRTSDARASYEEAHGLLEPLTRSVPGEPSYRADLGSSQWSLGWLLGTIGDPKGGLAWLERSRDTRATLTRDPRADATVRGDLARSYNSIANILLETGHPAEALASYQKALAIQERIAADDPSDAQHLSDLSVSLINIGIVCSRTGRPDEALTFYERGRAVLERLTAENPNVTKFQNYLAYCGFAVGSLQARHGRPLEALEAYSASLAVRERLAADNPKVTEYRSELSVTYSNIAGLLDELGRTDEAEVPLRKALAIEEDLVREEPKVTRFQDYLAAYYLTLGEFRFRGGRTDEARVACERALRIRQKLAADNPTVTDFRRELEGCYNVIGDLLVQAGQEAEALESYWKALAIAEALAAEAPAITMFQNDLARHLNPIGLLLLKAGRSDEAAAAIQRALAISRELVAAEPSNLDPQVQLAAAHKGLGLWHSRAGRRPEAAAAFRRAAELAEAIAATGRRDVLYGLAGCRALLARALGPDGPAPITADARAEADRAMAALRRAVDSGFRNARMIRSDADLGPLRPRADFQLLLRDLDFPADPFEGHGNDSRQTGPSAVRPPPPRR